MPEVMIAFLIAVLVVFCFGSFYEEKQERARSLGNMLY